MDHPGDDSTLPMPPAAARARGDTGECLLLTVIFHPDASRIGARALRPVRDSGNGLELGREEPVFAGPEQPEQPEQLERPERKADAGLGDPYVSRRALLLRGGGDRWTLERPRGSSRCRVDGEDVFASVELDGDALRRGIRLLLGHGVLLLLRLAPSAEAGEAPAPVLPGLLGDSGYLRALRRQLLRVAASDSDVLLCGPTGTGKELVARALHGASGRSAGPLVSVNVAAIPAELAAAQLFGASRGAFTGAERDQRGYFERAAGGTLFLDEIGDAPPALQPQLLRALEQREIQVVGGEIRKVSLRVISATDAPIHDAGATFNSALRHRLGALELRLRPLVAHREDIGTLASHYLALAFDAAGRGALWEARADDPARLARCAELFDAFLAYAWPGNIRELSNLCRELAVACPEDFSLPPALARRLAAAPAAARDGEAFDERRGERRGESRDEGRDEGRDAGRHEVSEADFAEAWAANDFEVARVARALKLSRGAVYRRVKDVPGCRLAGDIPRQELHAALAAAAGDLATAARQLCVSQAGLRTRLRAAGDQLAADNG